MDFTLDFFDALRRMKPTCIEDIVARETRRDFAIWSEVFAGQTSVSIRVTPIDDTEIEPTETITLTLVPDAGQYRLRASYRSESTYTCNGSTANGTE